MAWVSFQINFGLASLSKLHLAKYQKHGKFNNNYQDIVFKNDLKLDLYSGENVKGAIIDIHGGGWFHGDKAKDEDLATRLAQEGYIVFIPNYRLTLAVTFPAGREDILSVLEWIKQSAYVFDRNKIAVWGSSAGGNLGQNSSKAIKTHAIIN